MISMRVRYKRMENMIVIFKFVALKNKTKQNQIGNIVSLEWHVFRYIKRIRVYNSLHTYLTVRKST